MDYELQKLAAMPLRILACGVCGVALGLEWGSLLAGIAVFIIMAYLAVRT